MLLDFSCFAQVTVVSHMSFLVVAKFIFDLSPIAVNYKGNSRHWYDYITSIMAIVGGTFTVVGLIESTIATAVSRRPRYS